MEVFKKVIGVFIGLPIGFTICMAICIFASLFLPITAIWKCIDKFIFKDYCKSAIDSMCEFVFVVYGFGALFMIFPLCAIDPDYVEDF